MTYAVASLRVPSDTTTSTAPRDLPYVHLGFSQVPGNSFFRCRPSCFGLTCTNLGTRSSESWPIRRTRRNPWRHSPRRAMMIVFVLCKWQTMETESPTRGRSRRRSRLEASMPHASHSTSRFATSSVTSLETWTRSEGLSPQSDTLGQDKLL